MKQGTGEFRFLCEEPCVNTAGGESWRGGQEYNFTRDDVMHLADIGHLKRFLPINDRAIVLIREMQDPADEKTKKAEKSISDMTVAELKEAANDRGIDVPSNVRRGELVSLLSEEYPEEE